MSASTTPYVVYLLVSETTPHKTYVGCTNNMARRIRQHNGEITGGAKITHTARPWRVHTTIHGFQNYRQALQFEWAVKHPYRRGVAGRLENAAAVMRRERWTSRAPLSADIPLHTTTWSSATAVHVR